MKIFIDTAKLNEIKSMAFLIDGVTTNPSLIKEAIDECKEEKVDMETYIEKILETAGEGHPVSLEVIGLTEKEMFDQAMKLYKKFNPVANNVVIKIPVNPSTDKSSTRDYDGLKVISRLSKEGVPINGTLVMTPGQALLVAKAGAKYVSPFAGRIDDYLRKKLGIKHEKGDYFNAKGIKKGDGEILHDNGIVSGVDLVRNIVQMFRNYNLECEVIAASARNPRQVREFALVGADIATIPFSVLKDMLSHEKTREGVKKFTEDVVPEYATLF